jgi:hypothetical protein
MKTFLMLLALSLTAGYLTQTEEVSVVEMKCPIADNIECIDMPPMFITAAIITK